MNNLAADIKIAPSGGFKGFGPLGDINETQSPINVFTKFISNIIGIMTIVAFIWFTFVIITSAISWIGAGGDKQAIETARKKITNGIIGLVITISAIFLIDVVGKLIGVDILNLPALFLSIIGISL